MNSLEWVFRQQEGQFFERKSCFDFLEGELRSVSAVARDVAEKLVHEAHSVGGGFSSRLSTAALSLGLL